MVSSTPAKMGNGFKKGCFMHKKLFWILTSAAIVSLFGCGDDAGSSASSKPANDSETADKPYEEVDSVKDLDKCGNETKGDTVYVKALSSYYQCDGKTWKIVDDEDMPDITPGADSDADSDDTPGTDAESESSSSRGTPNDADGTSAETEDKSSSSKRPTIFDDDDGGDDEAGDDEEAVSSSDSKKSSSSRRVIIDEDDDPELQSSSSRGTPSADPEIQSSSSRGTPSTDPETVSSSSDVTPGTEPEPESSSSRGTPSTDPIVPSGPVTINEIAEKFYMATSCDVFSEGYVIYIQEDEKAYICTERGYVEIIIDFTIPKSSSSSKVSSSSKENTDSSSSEEEALEELSSSSVFTSRPVSFVDSRDEREYSLVTIGSQIWMAENLNYVTIGGRADDRVASWCYKNKDENCADNGRLYTWAAVMNLSEVYNTSSYTGSAVSGICPEGLRIPSEKDWLTLKNYIAASSYTLEEYGFTTQVSGHYQETDDDDAGFDNGPLSANPEMEFWSATEFTEKMGMRAEISSGSPIVLDSKYKVHAYAVRCLKDALETCSAENVGVFAKTNSDILICKEKGSGYAWQFANSSEQLDYYFGRCSAEFLNKYDVKDNYAYICKRSIDDDKNYVYAWELAKNADYIAYVLNDFKCSDGAVKEGRPLNAYPLNEKRLYTTQYYCEEGVWRTATRIEYNTYGQDCILDRVTAGRIDTTSYYYCSEEGWRVASVLEYDTDGRVCVEGKVIPGNVNKSYYYICDDGAWRRATTLEYDTYEQPHTGGLIIKGNINKTRYYYYDAETGWRDATVTEYDTYKYSCDDGLIVYGRVNTLMRYICDDGAWRAPTTLEIDTYQQTCTDKLIITGNENKSTYYYCEKGKWRLATTKDRDIDGVECRDGEIFYGLVTGATYICGKDDPEYLLSFEGSNIPHSEDIYVNVPFNQTVCIYVDFDWDNIYYTPNISLLCEVRPGDRPGLTLEVYYGGESSTYQGEYNISYSGIRLGPVQYGHNTKENVCVTVTGAEGGTAKCFLEGS